jgi:hypothetical protein
VGEGGLAAARAEAGARLDQLRTGVETLLRGGPV